MLNNTMDKDDELFIEVFNRVFSTKVLVSIIFFLLGTMLALVIY